jgi:dTDP-glucose 4,6-dehydratase
MTITESEVAKKKILVTGGAGFIGANFVHYISRERSNWEVVVLDKLTYSGNISNINSLIDAGKITFVKGDITSRKDCEYVSSLGTWDYVFHFAAESHVDRSIMDSTEFLKTNIIGTQCLIDVLKKKGVAKFIHISTDEVYGSLGSEGLFYEDTQLDPTSPYAASKASSDLVVLSYFKTFNFPVVITRCTNNYGAFQFPEKMIPLFVINALRDEKLPLYGDGKQIRSWIHVDDHCAGVLACAELGRVGQVYNLGGQAEDEVTNKVVAERILTYLEKPFSLIKHVEDRLAHDTRYAVDTTKARTELKWTPKHNFDSGLLATIDWYKVNKTWWENIMDKSYQDYYHKMYNRALA